MSLEAANREVYLLLKEGIRVSVADNEPQQKCSAVLEHIYESYPERDLGVDSEAG
jgi:hypothetical protein